MSFPSRVAYTCQKGCSVRWIIRCIVILWLCKGDNGKITALQRVKASPKRKMAVSWGKKQQNQLGCNWKQLQVLDSRNESVMWKSWSFLLIKSFKQIHFWKWNNRCIIFVMYRILRVLENLGHFIHIQIQYNLITCIKTTLETLRKVFIVRWSPVSDVELH